MPTNDNELILQRLRGVPAQPGTPETDADPRNPNVMRCWECGHERRMHFTCETCGADPRPGKTKTQWAEEAQRYHKQLCAIAAIEMDWLQRLTSGDDAMKQISAIFTGKTR